MKRAPGSPLQRRALLRALGAAGIAGALGRGVALAAGDSDEYRALVCVFLQGGNDGENMIVPCDDRGYANYASIRSPASGLNIPQRSLLPIQPASLATPFGFHPACGPLQALFAGKQLAVVANVGMLAKPVTRSALLTGGARRPANLFSHNDQQLALQSADPTGSTRIGWGGRIADQLEALNARRSIPAVASTSGLQTFTTGRNIALTVNDTASLRLIGSGTGDASFDALREEALRDLLMHPTPNTYEHAARTIARQGLEAASTVRPILENARSIVPQCFAGLQTGIAAQLRTVAQLIEGRQFTGVRRQVFYVNHAGYDTHATQLSVQGRLLGELSTALAAFHRAMLALGCNENVTLFTLSDFGRTFKPASSSGTDHGWGNFALVLGGAVAGGDFYGRPPVPVLGGPDDLGNNGRWIPTTSLEQYALPLARWLGVGEADLRYVFPNAAAFSAGGLPLLRSSRARPGPAAA